MDFFKDLLQKVPHHGIKLWLQVQIFYDRIDEALKKTVDYTVEGRLTIQYADEGWNDPEEKVKQLKEYMEVIMGDFMQLSLKVTRSLKEKMKENGSKLRKIKIITRYPNTKVLETPARHKLSKNPMKKVFPNTSKSIPKNSLCIRRLIQSGDIIDWEFLASQGLDRAFFESINSDPFFGPQWVNRFQTNEHVYRESVRELFDSFEFAAFLCRACFWLATGGAKGDDNDEGAANEEAIDEGLRAPPTCIAT
nr:hypothetical protein [Tanacetum cinerariifolium]